MSEHEFRHEHATVNGIDMHYVVAGEGDPVFLLHGFPQTWYEWHDVIPELAEDYTVIAPDLRGLGDTAKPDGGYDKRTIGEDVYALSQELGFEEFALIGHDFGGAAAYACAANHRESVSCLGLLEIVLPGFGLEEAMDAADEPHFWHLGFHMAEDIPEALVKDRERMYIRHFIDMFIYDPTAITEEDLDVYERCYSAPGGFEAGFDYYRAMRQDAEHNREHAEDTLEIPVLALGGSYCQGGAVQQSAGAVAEDVRGGVIDRCGHWIPEERPEVLVDRLRAFIGDGV